MKLDIEKLAEEVENKVQHIYKKIDQTAMHNHRRVLNAFKKAKVSEYHLKGSTGYGYNDAAKDVLEQIYSDIFGGQSALVRCQIISGTHAIALCLFGILKPGEQLLVVQGDPYDTLKKIIGIGENICGSLQSYGIKYKQIELLPDGEIDLESIKKSLEFPVKMVMLQRSRGYSLNPPLGIAKMKSLIRFIKNIQPDTIIFVDNCYGELVETKEPCHVGADLIAGSLMKNPGGGIAPTGGYVVGRKDLVEMAATRWTAPGITNKVGPTLELHRLLMQGIFLAPHIVAEALKGAVFTACLFEQLGFKVFPKYNEDRTDIIQAIVFNNKEKLISFCQAIQNASPVDSHITLEPCPMPGYEDAVIMAAGTFIQGSSIELSADAPLREPYAVYVQGGLSKEYIKLAVLSAAKSILSNS
ncbi:methionine gamma-lyase family protein [Peptococcaceae bacterium]|nr:methionine gamma-lyase family protein [Peptococcaceae bacterium]MCL0062853.1 methionine gamma-lyase family protein [Peptococcaceae bacterium]